MKLSKGIKFLEIIILIFSISFLINLLWEVAHSLLYNWSALPLVNDVYAYIPRILKASIGDGFITLGIYGLGLIKNRRVNWISNMKWGDYFLVILAGLFISVLIERVNVHFLGRWSYNEFMPLIPGIDVGLTPILQMLILPLLIFKIINFFKLVEKLS